VSRVETCLSYSRQSTAAVIARAAV
jgi:hypothetical protein